MNDFYGWRLVRREVHMPLYLLVLATTACKRSFLPFALALAMNAPTLAQNISTVAGSGTAGYSGDGSQATAAQLDRPSRVALDAAGNLYIADENNHRIRKMDSAGVISTVAGTGTAGYSGDGDQATGAQLDRPQGVALDAAGNLYIADPYNHRIRKVNSAGVISTIAGTEFRGDSGDGGQATAARLNYPWGVAVDAAGNLYIADSSNHRIRKVDSAGTISTVVGTGSQGYSGDGGQANTANLDFPYTVKLDAAGNLYIADANNSRIRKVDSAGVINTVAGNGSFGFSGDGAQATAAQITHPMDIALDTAGNLYIADVSANRIRKVDSSGVISTVAGTGRLGYSGDGGPATDARFNFPYGVALDAAGNLYIADSGNNRIRKVFAVSPDAPTAANAVAGSAQATVFWAAPASDGGSPITSYTATAVQDNTKTCTPTPATSTTCTVAGLANGTAYTFTVVASNSVGPGTASAPSTAVTPLGLPGAPTAVTAVAGNGQATVSWTAPTSNGGSVLTSYTVAGTPAGTCTVAAPATTCLVPALGNGVAHSFTVVATNALGASAASGPSALVTPTAPPSPPEPDPGPINLPINTPGATTTIADPSLPIVIGPNAGGGTIVLPGTGTTHVQLQVTINGQPLSVQMLPGSHLRITQVDGQNVLVLVVVQGWASMTSTSVGQPMALAGRVLLRSGAAGTRIEAQPLTVAVLTGSLVPSQGSLPQVGSMGLQAGERLQVNSQGALVSITLGSLQGNTSQPGDAMAFANLPASMTVDKSFARIAGPLARLSGANLAQGLETASFGVFLLRDGVQIFQLLPTLPVTIDATLPDGLGFTPLGLLRWVRAGVVVQFAPAVADLAGLESAVAALLPDARIRLSAEGVLQVATGGRTYVFKPGWTGAGAGATAGVPQIGVDEQGRIVFQTGNGPRQLLLPALLHATQAQALFQAAVPGATLAIELGSNEGAFMVKLAGQQWRLVPQGVLSKGVGTQVSEPTSSWWMGADGLLYLTLREQVQGVRILD